jgi:hypothetical protein
MEVRTAFPEPRLPPQGARHSGIVSAALMLHAGRSLHSRAFANVDFRFQYKLSGALICENE